jgi:hypothetical protein
MSAGIHGSEVPGTFFIDKDIARIASLGIDAISSHHCLSACYYQSLSDMIIFMARTQNFEERVSRICCFGAGFSMALSW